jgi:hypothetical protein
MDVVGDPLAMHYDYASLTVADLLRARDQYHYHLMNKRNVVGTAIGYYLIRDDEPPLGETPPQAVTAGHRPRRTFANSVVRDDSWPCVLVLVSQWQTKDAFGSDPTKMVPETLYLSDGQMVPVCVVEVDARPDGGCDTGEPPDVPPAWGLGGGLPIRVTAQGVEHRATAGCLVSDGHYTYALTASHVCGGAGTAVHSRLRGGDVMIGESTDKQLAQLPFGDAYPDFPGTRTYCAVDAGLIQLTDLTQWTSNIYGLPPLDEMEDVHDHNLSLRLIDRTVTGYGAASGRLTGRIKALFYRYRSVGGFDYVGDFLISPQPGTRTRHGDSGMIWNLDVTATQPAGPPAPVAPVDNRTLRPLAMEWGGQQFGAGGTSRSFAVATSLSTVCRELGVMLVTDQPRGMQGYWGRVGHYSIAAFAVGLVGEPKLKALLTNNLDLLSFDLTALRDGDAVDKRIGALAATDEFVPLADVPDEVWKKRPPPAKHGRVGGRDTQAAPTGSIGPEHPNHYADIDEPDPDGRTWRSRCLADDTKISVPAWLDFYHAAADRYAAAGRDDLARQYRNPLRQGLLPFRVWQLFETMVAAARAGNMADFLTAAGVCAHYVGDASQPLHGSVLADGDPHQPSGRTDPHTGKPVNFGDGAHSPFETAMVNRHSGDLITKITAKLPVVHGLPLCDNGHAAARATLQEMDDVATILPPHTILASYEAHGAAPHVATVDGMWADLGDATADVMARGATTLAMIWESAWRTGGGAGADESALGLVDQLMVRARYTDPTFAPSCTLADIAAQLGVPVAV